MKDWWIKSGCFLTGWNYKILESCTESSRKQLKKYTSAILILIILWAFIGFSFAQRYVQTPWWISILIALIFIVIIIQIERQIILTVGKNRFLSIFRFVIAIIMAIIGSAILDQMIFKDDIEKKMIEIVDKQVNEQLPNRLLVIDSKLRELQLDIDSLDKKNIELYSEISSRPTLNTVSSSTTYLKVQQTDGTFKTIPQHSFSTNPIANPKIKEADVNNQHLDGLRKQQEDYTKRKMDAENSLRKELLSKKGFLEELNAVVVIISESTVALIFYLILFLFLTSLELFVLVSKSKGNKCDYDLVIEHQLEQKQRTLNQLIN